MVPDISKLKSHPDKLLFDHIDGVVRNVKKLTDSRFAELLAIFHDLGKINPNFQDKLIPNKQVKGYANHAYLSAYAFFCTFASTYDNRKILEKWLNIQPVTSNHIIALSVLLAKHHGNIPDFSSEDKKGTGASILSKDENLELFRFLNVGNNLPVSEFIEHFFQCNCKMEYLTNTRVQQGYLEKLKFDDSEIQKVLPFFLDVQFAFASVIQADKADAAKFDNFVDSSQKDVETFCKDFSLQLRTYLKNLDQGSELNRLRTTIRNESITCIRKGIDIGKKVFELTAPTGSGKTLMMLSLTSEIIENKGAFRIIYALPFLSITEQVETEVLKIFSNQHQFIQRVDSKSQNKRFEDLQKELELNPTEEKILEMNLLEFQENTFAYPFVITTFVRFFETLLSNRNGELLKLPNFSKSVFLLDEIQALPPRLYGFFVAYLTEFCRKFDSYAIISTATQPNFTLPEDHKTAKEFFSNYQNPYSLLPLNYFSNPLFNRYQINLFNEPIGLETLKEKVVSENQSVLVILSTIDDTRELYSLLKEELSKEEVLLLNTHITPKHRKLKIYLAKRRLREYKRIILVSTQLIEAGVDIDFPIVYRDFATVASIVQSAGRCNRNGKLNYGNVRLFKLLNKGKVRSEIIYQGKDKEILRFTKDAFKKQMYQENELMEVQKEFFNRIQSDLNWGMHSQNSPRFEYDFLKDIQECQFDKIGQFQLIDKQVYGEDMQYYVPQNDRDTKFEKLLCMDEELKYMLHSRADIVKIRQKKKSIEIHLKTMADQIIQIRMKRDHVKPILGHSENYFGLNKLSLNSYSFETGIDIKGNDCIL